MTDFDRECEEYLLYLYELASYKYSDHHDVESLIQDTMMAYIVKRNQGESIGYPKGFLSAVMKNKYNEWLREKYRNSIVTYGYEETVDPVRASEESEERKEQYESVRRELGRLISIYREVTVRHYVHGHTVERIANDLGIPVGTVKSRLASARGQIKEGLQKMEKYGEASYEPKNVTIGIWGNDSYQDEPFSLLHSKIEGNILVVAYEKPISVREIADTMGMPCAYVEPLIDKLVAGELMGRTDGGLVYTRCFMQKHSEQFGDIALQEAISEKYAERVWEIVWRNVEPLTARHEFAEMTEKQRATLMIYLMTQAITEVISGLLQKDQKVEPPQRPHGGEWLAFVRVLEPDEELCKFDSSGPVYLHYGKNDGETDCVMHDYQSVVLRRHALALLSAEYKLVF